MAILYRRNIISEIISRISLIMGAALLFNAGLAAFLSDSSKPFLITSLIAFLAGITLSRKRKSDSEVPIHRKEAFLSVTIAWLYISLIGCLPFIISGTIPDFINAWFESVSGFTTTGSTILNDIQSLPQSILFWRSFTHWIGGIGIIVLFIVVMPSLHEGGYHLFTLESSFQERIQPKIRSIGQRLLLIYISLTLLEILLLLAGGMNLFESSCHAFGTVSTGGFSPKNSSIGEYSPYIQYVIMFFMLVSGMNFTIHYFLWKRAYKQIKKNEEVKTYLLVILIIGILLTIILFTQNNKTLETSFRESFFQIISIITGTGYATTDYLLWPVQASTIIFLAFFIGGCTGSTSGGIKIVRHILVFKNIKRLSTESSHPFVVIPIRLNDKKIDEATNRTILNYPVIYILIFFAGSFILLLTNIDFQTATSSAATAIANIGPGFGTVGPAANFSHFSTTAKLTMTGLMILGRLEIYTVLSLMIRKFWIE